MQSQQSCAEVFGGLPHDAARRSSTEQPHFLPHTCPDAEECNVELEVVQYLLLKLGSIGTYSQISLNHYQNACTVQDMEEGDFLVLLFEKDTLKSHYTQLFQCRIPYYYVAHREDAPGKMQNIELQIQMAGTVVRSPQVSPSLPCRGLQASTRRFKAAHLALCSWQSSLHHAAPRGSQGV